MPDGLTPNSFSIDKTASRNLLNTDPLIGVKLSIAGGIEIELSIWAGYLVT